jgi:tetratricopeptide (TPR) repeat protein
MVKNNSHHNYIYFFKDNWKCFLNFLLLIVMLMLIFIVFSEIRSKACSVTTIYIPKNISTNELTLEQFSDQVTFMMLKVANQANLFMKKELNMSPGYIHNLGDTSDNFYLNLSDDFVKLDFEIPGGNITYKSFIHYLKKMAPFAINNTITINVLPSGDNYKVFIAIHDDSGNRGDKNLNTETSLYNTNIDLIIDDILKSILLEIKPCIYSCYYELRELKELKEVKESRNPAKINKIMDQYVNYMKDNNLKSLDSIIDKKFKEASEILTKLTKNRLQSDDKYGFLGLVYINKIIKKDYSKVIKFYEEIILRDENDINAYNNLAWLFATCSQIKNRKEKAVEYAKKACALTKEKNYFSLRILAMAYAQNRNFEDARKIQERANILLLKFIKDKKNKFYIDAVKALDDYKNNKIPKINSDAHVSN